MAAYPIPPWLQAQNPAPIFLQGVSQGSEMAARQNAADQAAAQMAQAQAQQQQAQQMEAFRAAQQLAQLQLQRDAERRRQELEGQQLVGLKLENQQAATRQAQQLAQQNAFQRLQDAGADAPTAFMGSIGMAPFSDQVKYFSQQASQSAINARQQKAQDASIARATGVRIYDDSGNEIPGAREKAYSVREQLAQPVFAQKVAAYDKAIKAANPDWTDEDTQNHAAAMAQAAITGKPPQIDKKIVQSVDALSDTVSATKRVLDEVNQFNKKYGENAFDGFIGPLDARIVNWKNKLGVKADDAIKDAQKIFNDASDVSGEFQHARYGSALSAGERQEFQNTVSPKESANFLQSLQSFAQRQENKVKTQLELHPDSYYPGQISPEIRKRFSGSPSATLASGSQQQQNLVPRKTPDGKVALFDAVTKKFVRYAE